MGKAASCFSPIGMYGLDKDHFVKRLNEGYTEIANGGGPWVIIGFPDPNNDDLYLEEELRIVGLWVFYHPDGRVATIETLKFYDPSGCTVRSAPTPHEYKPSKRDEIQHKSLLYGRLPESFRRLIGDYKLRMSKRQSLKDLLDSWSGEIRRD